MNHITVALNIGSLNCENIEFVKSAGSHTRRKKKKRKGQKKNRKEKRYQHQQKKVKKVKHIHCFNVPDEINAIVPKVHTLEEIEENLPSEFA
jgi:hypothetical protein